MTEDELLQRITVAPTIFGGKSIIRGMRIAVEHVLGMLAAGDRPDRLLQEYPFLEATDIQACLAYAHRSRPAGVEQTRLREAHGEIADRGGIQEAGINHGGRNDVH